MKKAGALVALIAGIFATIAALITLFVGGIGSAFYAHGSNTVIGLGWGGILFSFITIIASAVALGAKSTKPAITLICSAGLGIFLGGTLVALFMVLSMVGGIINLLAVKKELPAVSSVGKRPLTSASTSTNFCTECGAKSTSSSAFCSECGAKIK